MAEIKITLKKNWVFDTNKTLGKPGGFGQVYLGCSESETEEIVAIKKLFYSPDSKYKRELKLAEFLVEREFENVINILDYGYDESSNAYYVVMEKADHSLQDEIESGKEFSDREAIEILDQINKGLLEVDGIIHRDLKPDNILFCDGIWKISDFGIAKFAENATSSETVKGFLSILYASPEQINLEEITQKTDIYSLACIGYTLLTGNPPFFKGDRIEIANQHRFSTPPTLKLENKALIQLLFRMLSKSPENRPTSFEVDTYISETIMNPKLSVDSPLTQAAAIVSEEAAIRETILKEQQSILDKRLTAGTEAARILYEISNDLLSTLESAALGSRRIFAKVFQQIYGDLPSFNIGLAYGKANLYVKFPLNEKPYKNEEFKESGWDVICGGKIAVIQNNPNYEWSASLWFTNEKKLDSYRWIEVLYWYNGRSRSADYPFAPMNLDDIRDADFALAPIGHVFSIARNPIPIDAEYEQLFISRWEKIFADACLGKLKYPRKLPLED